MYNHSSRASDGSRPADDAGRRSEVPVGVDPMINMQHGEAKDSFLAGITAHDGGGVLSSGFQRQHRVGPPALKGEKRGFQTFKHDFILKVNAGHLWPLRRSGDTSGTSRRSVQIEGSVITERFFK